MCFYLSKLTSRPLTLAKYAGSCFPKETQNQVQVKEKCLRIFLVLQLASSHTCSYLYSSHNSEHNSSHNSEPGLITNTSKIIYLHCHDEILFPRFCVNFKFLPGHSWSCDSSVLLGTARVSVECLLSYYKELNTC